MTSLTMTARGPAPAVEVWRRYVDLDRWARWAPQISRVDADERRLAPGLRGRVVGPLGVTVGFEIDAVDERARTWSWQVRLGPVRLRLRHAVWSEGAGSGTSLRVSGPLPLIVAYAPVARYALHRLVAR